MKVKLIKSHGSVRQVKAGDLYRPRWYHEHPENLLLIMYTHEEDGNDDLVTVMPIALEFAGNAHRAICSIAGATALLLPEELFDCTSYAAPLSAITLNQISLGSIYGELPLEEFDSLLDDFLELEFAEAPTLHHAIEVMPSIEEASELNPYREHFLEYLVREQQGLNR